MERTLKNIPGVCPYFDDVLMAGESASVLAERLCAVLQRFREAGLKLKREKCRIGVESTDFLGFRIDAAGIHPSEVKLQTIQQAPTPKSKGELQAFLGLLNFYHSFLPHKAALAEPLHRLLDKQAPWVWSSTQNKAFSAVKSLLSSDSVLVHFNETLPVTLACDASPYGIGAVLSHRMPDGREAPIAYYSRTLSTAERNYAQIDKEALAIVAGIKKFHDFLNGRTFTIFTDHKPLLGLFTADKQTPQILSPRMLRWSIFMAAYSYQLVHRPGKEMGHADALSRLPLPQTEPDPAPACHILAIQDLPDIPLHAGDVAAETTTDRTLSRVLNWVLSGWPVARPGSEFQHFFSRKNELSAHKGCVLWGSRVIIPPSLHSKVLDSLHEGHPGIVRMKALARSYLWPGLDKDIEKQVRSCQGCQESRPEMPQAPVHRWETTYAPWSRVHIDFAGPFQGQVFLIVVDSYSKCLEVVPVSSMTTTRVIRELRRLFATHGLPDVIVSDNGAQFTAAEFQSFLNANMIRHIKSAPFHPATNGQAERMVRTTKEALKRMTNGDWNHRLANFLLCQHTTPTTATSRSPAELRWGRRLTTKLDRLHPDRLAAETAQPKPPGTYSQVNWYGPGTMGVGHLGWQPG
uniref:Gypsy retrotransposon integrase-like protein 1 n=1 Tax=Leptobrachium leishanense TaxID=445787 RepID=A0A8C5Q3F0_9ANUR